MKRVYGVLLSLVLLAAGVRADETVPRTVEGGSAKVKSGGNEIGEGFRSLGRGIKKTFTGQESKQDYKGAAKIGEGFRDLGTGTAGVGRGVGLEVKKAFTGREDKSPEEQQPGKLHESNLE